MILVDKDIKNRKDEIFIENYDENSVQPISYDIHVDKIIAENGNLDDYDLEPRETIMVRCQEKIRVPNDLIIRIENKNSLIRLGLTVTSPVYNPGHSTPVYIRVENVSSKVIKLNHKMPIGQMIFEMLSSVPQTTYDRKVDASFNDEDKYRHLGKYSSILENQTKKMQEVKDNLDNKESSIYANILTMMGIFVSIFSLITVNFSAINNGNFNKDFILSMNISLGLVITLFIGLIFIFLNKKENKAFKYIYLFILGGLIVLLLYII